MIRKSSLALMITEEDIEEILAEWSEVPGFIKAHVKARSPLHRCEGELSLDEGNLTFRGRDIKEGKGYELAIPLERVTDVYLGFSKHLKAGMDPAFGIGGPVPVAVHYQDNGKDRIMYFNTGFNSYLVHGDTNSRHWCEALQEAVAKHRPLKLAARRNPSLLTV